MSDALICDGLVLLVLLAFVLWGYCRGLIMTVASVVVLVTACVGATMVSDTISPVLTQALTPKMEAYLQSYLDEQGLPSAQDTVESYLAGSELEMFIPLLEQESFGEIGDAVEDFASSTLSAVAERITQGVLQAGIWLVTFLVLQILLSILIRAVDLVSKLPVISTANAVGGALVGVLWGVVVLCVLIGVGSWFGWLPGADVSEQTVIYRVFADKTTALLALLIKAV